MPFISCDLLSRSRVFFLILFYQTALSRPTIDRFQTWSARRSEVTKEKECCLLCRDWLNRWHWRSCTLTFSFIFLFPFFSFTSSREFVVWVSCQHRMEILLLFKCIQRELVTKAREKKREKAENLVQKYLIDFLLKFFPLYSTKKSWGKFVSFWDDFKGQRFSLLGMVWCGSSRRHLLFQRKIAPIYF